MVGLVDQLQTDCLERSVSIVDLVRKAKTIATRLGLADCIDWIGSETSGYAEHMEVPPYRHLQCDLKFLNPAYGWSPIFGSEHVVKYRKPLPELVVSLGVDTPFFTMPVPGDVVAQYGEQISMLVEVRRHFPRAALVGIVDGIRNTILDWALDLWRADVHGRDMSFTEEERQRAGAVTVTMGDAGKHVVNQSKNSPTETSWSQRSSISRHEDKVTRLVDHIELAITFTEFPKSIVGVVMPTLFELRQAISASSDPYRLLRGLKLLRTVMESGGESALIAEIVSRIDDALGKCE